MNDLTPWLDPSPHPDLAEDEIHVWRAALDEHLQRLPALYETLSRDEQVRAASFHFARDRERFIVRRGLLRAILGRYLGMAPRQVRFSYGPQGKPALAGEGHAEAPRFNLSHSHGLALYAVAGRPEVGIDVERERADFAYDDIVAQFFAPQENAQLQALPAAQRRRAFYAGWTRKEAYVKATGQGLTLPPRQVVVSLRPDGPATLASVAGEALEASRWSLRALLPGPGYAAALAWQGGARRLTCWQWRD